MLSMVHGAQAALPPPVILCISLDENDDIKIVWSLPNDPNNEFIAYQAYYQASSTSSFIPLNAVTNAAQDSLLEIGNFTGNSKFYVVTLFDDGNGIENSISSDTISPIIATVVAIGDSAKISWTSVRLPSPDSIYRINKRPVGGDFGIFDSTAHDTLCAYDSLIGCVLEASYQIEITGVGGCISESSIPSIRLEDNTPPEATNLTCASVDTATGHVILEWEPTSSGDVGGYLFNFFSDFIWGDTTMRLNGEPFVYSEDEINALVRPETLSVSPFDTCDAFPAPDLFRFSTLFGQLINIDRCAGTVALKWNLPTEENPVAVRNTDEYRIYAKGADGISVLRGTVGALDSVFIDSGLVLGENYDYVIAAYDATIDKEAISNKISVTLGAPDLPDYLYITCASGNHETGNNVIRVATDSSSDVVAYVLLRAIDREGPYQRILVDTESAGMDFFSLRDESVYSEQSPFFYMVEGRDECGTSIVQSDTVRTMNLEGYLNTDDLLVSLEWNEYEGFDSAASEVDGYDLIRVSSNIQRDILYGSRRAGEFVDDLEPLENVNGRICYYVEANESNFNTLGLMETCRSNLLCFDQEPRVFIPNAFTPDDDFINDTFLPYINYVNPQEYQLWIFDRSGSLVFETEDQNEGWNGDNHPIGVYVYRVQVVNARGEKDVFDGKLHLIR